MPDYEIEGSLFMRNREEEISKNRHIKEEAEITDLYGLTIAILRQLLRPRRGRERSAGLKRGIRNRKREGLARHNHASTSWGER